MLEDICTPVLMYCWVFPTKYIVSLPIFWSVSRFITFSLNSAFVGRFVHNIIVRRVWMSWAADVVLMSDMSFDQGQCRDMSINI